MVFYVSCLINRVFEPRMIDCNFFVAIRCCNLLLCQKIVWVVLLKFSKILLMKMCVVFIDTVHCSKVINVQEVECLLEQSVHRIFIV